PRRGGRPGHRHRHRPGHLECRRPLARERRGGGDRARPLRVVPHDRGLRRHPRGQAPGRRGGGAGLAGVDDRADLCGHGRRGGRPAALVWEVRTTGAGTNAGAFDPSVTSPGTDYSQQDAAQITYTDLVIGGTTTQLTSAANPFTSAHVGNTINVTGGTGFTA